MEMKTEWNVTFDTLNIEMTMSKNEWKSIVKMKNGFGTNSTFVLLSLVIKFQFQIRWYEHETIDSFIIDGKKIQKFFFC